jgi:Dynamin family
VMLVERLKLGHSRSNHSVISALKALTFTEDKLPATARGRLLRSIADGPLGAALEAEASIPKSAMLSIGTVLREAQLQIIERAEELSALSGTEVATYLSDLILGLRKQVCTIAVVGQMNAGKSKLINILIEDPSLLPSHINPWTTVVTKLHFGVPGRPSGGASFEFFSSQEWDWLSTGGQIRRITQNVIPDFDWSALAGFVRKLKDKAEKRHGPQFARLLGSKHSYPQIAPGLLARYVAAGPEGAEAHETNSAGEYADLTKAANVYFDLGPFNFPTIVLDTPGVNDPFLVRDEITRQSLREADVCIVVVTAKQPLCEADLALLRLLRGLDKNSLILFVNKLDEVMGGDEARELIIERIRGILDREFPAVHIPIVFGSAHWGSGAISLLRRSGAGPIGPGEDDFSHNNDEADHLLGPAVLFERSGFPALALKISEMMQSGAIFDSVAKAGLFVMAACHNAERCIRLELNLIETLEITPEEAHKRLEGLAATVSLLDQMFVDCDKSLKELCDLYIAKLRDQFSLVLQDFKATDHNAAGLPQEEKRMRDRLEAEYKTAWESAFYRQGLALEEFKAGIEKCLAPVAVLDIPLPQSANCSPELTPLSMAGSASLEGSTMRDLAGDAQENSKPHRIWEIHAAELENIASMLIEEAKAALYSFSGTGIREMRVLTLSYLQNSLIRVKHLAALKEGGRTGEVAPFDLSSERARREAELEIITGIAGSLPILTKKERKLLINGSGRSLHSSAEATS